jgi:hypothetical protein
MLQGKSLSAISLGLLATIAVFYSTTDGENIVRETAPAVHRPLPEAPNPHMIRPIIVSGHVTAPPVLLTHGGTGREGADGEGAEGVLAPEGSGGCGRHPRG